MKVVEAKRLVLDLIYRDMGSSTAVAVDSSSPDSSDPGKFVIAGKSARVIHHFSGWHVPINLDWFGGSFDEPSIQRQRFYWYVFAVPRLNRNRHDHYLICDYLQVRDWVLEFGAPLGRDHRDHHDWMANIHVDRGLPTEEQAYFRWGDEPVGQWNFLDRIVKLDNIAVVALADVLAKAGGRVGSFGLGGESEAHKRLKLYTASRPELLALSSQATSELEHSFVTGDRVDVLFNNHGPLRTVVEIELDKPDGILIGVHQAIKYRSLAAAESHLGLVSPDVGAAVVAFGPGDSRVRELADTYDVRLVTVNRREVLAPAG